MSLLANPRKLKERNINVQFILTQDEFATGDNSLNLSGTSDSGISFEITIEESSAITQNEASLTIYGMTLEQISKLSRLNYTPLYIPRNVVTIAAGYDGILKNIFSGEIMATTADTVTPDKAFHCYARTGLYDSVKRAEHYNKQGLVPVNTIFKDLAAQLGLNYIPNPKLKDISIEHPILVGSTIQQMRELADNLRVSLKFSSNNNVYVYKKSDALDIPIVSINKDSGLLGNPELTQIGVRFRCRFDANLVWGAPFELTSNVPKTSGKYKVWSLKYLLANMHDAFEMEIIGVPFLI